MVLHMSRPWRHPETRVWHWRGRLPADVKQALDGEKMTVEVAGEASIITLRPTTKITLRTKDDSAARLRHASVQLQMEKRWQAERGGVVSLSHRDIHALAGVWYRELISTHEDDPGNQDDWDVYQDHLGDGLAYLDPASDGIESEPYDPKQAVRILSRCFDIDQFLSARGLKLDDGSRTKLIGNVAVALVQGAETLKRRARGDYAADEVATRFPVWRAEKAGPKSDKNSLLRMSDLLDGWAKESSPVQATLDLWRSYVESFMSYTQREDARAVQKDDVLKWKQHLLELRNSPKTINDSKLAALKAIFRWAVDNGLLVLNPATGVSVRRTNKKSGMQGFGNSEAATILRAAAKQTDPWSRWVPLLCAQSGARVAEVCQLRGEDIAREDGIPYMHFKAEAGSLKNRSSERRVPLHPYVVEAGFLDFVQRSGKGPLFFDPRRRRPGAKRPQPKIVAKNVARWIHTLGINVGMSRRKAPNHAWRHLFHTSALDAGIGETIINAIMGYAATNVRQTYGEVRLATAAKAIASIPLPGVYEPGAEALEVRVRVGLPAWPEPSG